MSRVSPPHVAGLLCNTLWGSQLSFAVFSPGAPVAFSSLWPDSRSLINTYHEAGLDQAPAELCKLLLSSNSFKVLEDLLKEKVISPSDSLGLGLPTLAHLACVLCSAEAVRLITRSVNGSSNGLWTAKDEEGRTPEDVCSNPELCRKIPHRPLFGRKRMATQQPLKSGDREVLFQQADDPEKFYSLMVNLKTYMFDVDREMDRNGDLLIHIAVKGGLASLPLLLALVYHFRANVNSRDRNGMTPLGVACQTGSVRVAEVLVCVLGADLFSRESTLERSPLHIAVSSKHPDVVSMLLKRGADACVEDKHSCSPAHLARKVGSIECWQLLVHHINEKISSLTSQAVLGTLDVSSLHSYDVCQTDEEGRTLLILVATHGHTHILKELVLIKNCPLNYRQVIMPGLQDLNTELTASLRPLPRREEHPLKTALHYAAEGGHTECVRILLDKRAHPALMDNRSWLPLHYACDGEHVECVRMILIQRNTQALSGIRLAKSIATDKDNQQILDILQEAAIRRQDEMVTPVLFDVAVSGKAERLLSTLENGDNVNPTNEAHDWPLLLAAGFGYLDVIEQLHQFGGHVTKAHQISGSTPLHVASRGGHVNVVRFLLKFTRQGGAEGGQDINARNTARATPLELAALQGHSKTVELLLDAGASCCLPDSTNRLVNCPGFSGTQFLLETYRKERLRHMTRILTRKLHLTEFKKVWQGPWDFNLRSEAGDTILMAAAQHALPEAVRFLLVAASVATPEIFITSSGSSPLIPSRHPTSLIEDSDPSPEGHTHFSPDPTHHTPLPYSPQLHKPHRGFQDSWEIERPMSALPSMSRHRRYTDQSRRKPRPQPPRAVPHRLATPQPRSLSYSRSDATSSEEEGMEPPVVMETPVPFNSGICSLVIRTVNNQYLQTALHRAADAGQAENLQLLAKADADSINTQDIGGDTALHLACRKTQKKEYRRTVEALLACSKLSVAVRNINNLLPEDVCPNSKLKKMLVKRRLKEAPPVSNGAAASSSRVAGVDLPSPPTTVHHMRGRRQPKQQREGLGQIPEVATPSPSQTSEVLSYSVFDQEMQHLRDRFNRIGSSSDDDPSP